MRMLLRIQIPVEKGNEAFKSGALQRTIQTAMEQLKPEAAYFYPEGGKRNGIMVFDMEGSWQLPPMLEPLFESLNASIDLTPVMNGEDLQRGFEAVGS